MVDLKLRSYQLKTGHHVVCFLDPSMAKRKRKKFSTRAEARAYQKKVESHLAVKGPEGFNSTAVNQLMQEHLEKVPNSRVRERKNSFLSFCEEFGDRPINQVGKNEIQAWFRKIKEEHDYSDRTLNTIKSNINAFFSFLVDENVIAISPLSKIRFERKPPPRRQRVVLSVDEVLKILEDTENFSQEMLYPFLLMAAFTGARRSEVLNLKRPDVDLEMGLVHFRNTKNGEDRAVRITGKLKSFLETHLTTHDSAWAFPDPEGTQIGRQRLQRLLRRFKKHFPNGKNWGPHSLRHSYAYNFLKMGGNMYQLQAILGHKSIQVTVDTYGQIAAQDVENVCPYEHLGEPRPRVSPQVAISSRSFAGGGK
jgi:integrase